MIHRASNKRPADVGRCWCAVALLALVAATSPACAEQKAPAASSAPTPTKPAPIDRNGVIILIRSTLLAVQQANVTGNYTVLRDLGSSSFHDANSAARLTEIFAPLRNQKLDLSGVLVLDPQLTVMPEINTAGLMHMAGFFPSAPLQVNFDLIFAPGSGRWDVYGVSVNIGQGGSVVPVPPAQPLPPPPIAAPPSRPPQSKK